KGDPRGRYLLELAATRPTRARTVRVLELVDAGRAAGLGEPTVDLALVALAEALGLPRGAASGLFALGRSAGWIAHAFEQADAGYVLRPRARYVGVLPVSEERR